MIGAHSASLQIKASWTETRLKLNLAGRNAEDQDYEAEKGEWDLKAQDTSFRQGLDADGAAA